MKLFSKTFALTLALLSPACDATFEYSDPIDSAADTQLDAAETSAKCTNASECPYGLSCDTVSGFCVECVTNGDCGEGENTRCDSELHICVSCTETEECPGFGNTCVKKHCVHMCSPSVDGGPSDCFGPPGTYCSSKREICARCDDDGDCPLTKHCYAEIGRCVECLNDFECTGHPGHPHCHPSRNDCVECYYGSDCAPGQPVCRYNKCVPS